MMKSAAVNPEMNDTEIESFSISELRFRIFFILIFRLSSFQFCSIVELFDYILKGLLNGLLY